jgi:hypothetical protein
VRSNPLHLDRETLTVHRHLEINGHTLLPTREIVRLYFLLLLLLPLQLLQQRQQLCSARETCNITTELINLSLQPTLNNLLKKHEVYSLQVRCDIGSDRYLGTYNTNLCKAGLDG